MRVFLDANILFSGSSQTSATRTLLDVLIVRAKVVSSLYAWEEARRNLVAKRPAQVTGLSDLHAHVEMTTEWVPVSDVECVEKDRPILGAAVASGCTHLWTSDRRHFGHLYGKRVRETLVVSSDQLLDILVKLDWL